MEDTRFLAWMALIHDMALKPFSGYELLRFPTERSRESASHLLLIHGMDEISKRF